MTDKPSPKGKKPDEPELEPDAWERFERAVDKAVKAPPQHKTHGQKKGDAAP